MVIAIEVNSQSNSVPSLQIQTVSRRVSESESEEKCEGREIERAFQCSYSSPHKPSRQQAFPVVLKERDTHTHTDTQKSKLLSGSYGNK